MRLNVFLFVFQQVSNLFARDEIDEICGELIPVMKKEYPRRPPTPENLYDYFLTRAKRNLHVALCFSPVSFSLIFLKKKPSSLEISVEDDLASIGLDAVA